MYKMNIYLYRNFFESKVKLNGNLLIVRNMFLKGVSFLRNIT